MKELSKKVAEVNYDGLITDIHPAVEVRGGIIKGGINKTLKRGTMLGRTVADGTLAEYNGSSESVKPFGILCDDTVVAADNVECAVYTAGCFDEDKVITKGGYKLTAVDKDELRMRNIVFKNAQKM